METQEELTKLREVLKEALEPIKNDVRTMKTDVAETRNDVKVLIAYFDREYVNLRKRIDKIEEHLGLQNS